ncbi:MAG: ATP-binding protein [Candidatus Tectimicrobiota bacterium]
MPLLIETAQQSWRILDHLPIGAVVLRQDFVVMFWNTCLEAWTGHARQSLLDTPIHLTFPGFAQPYYINRLKQVFDAGMPTIFSAQLHEPLLPAARGADEKRQQHITATPLQLDGSPERYALFTVQDVTDLAHSLRDCQTVRHQALAAHQARERLEAQISQSHKLEAIGTLAGGITHDFNNMLSAILGFTELAIHDTPPDHPLQRYLQQVLTAGRRARDLVQQILTFCHQQQPKRQTIQLQVLVKETLKLLRASLPSTIDIQATLDPAAAPVVADPTQMHQVLVNLCTNAEHAMRAQGGTLSVSLSPVEVDTQLALQLPLRPGPYVRLTVQDTGHGIAPAIRPHIFEPFFTTKEAGEGTGMGLAMVYSIVTKHGGSISVESEPDHGTTFTVYLPCSQQSVCMANSREEHIPTGHRERILFVDDETVLAHLGKAMLERLGYETVAHSSSREALELFRAAPQSFDLVITDQTMPQMTGEALAREIRSMRPDIPIILCTGFSRTMTPDKARALGIDALLHKPLVSRDLGLAIHRVLTRRLAA